MQPMLPAAATSPDFAEKRPELILLLAQVAETFHCPPSQLLRGTTTDLQIDIAAAAALWRWKEQVLGSRDQGFDP
jgi:hypothetical protein